MKIETIDDLKPYEKNAKIHDEIQIAKIANSINTFGFRQAVLVDGDGTIIVGHGRVAAAKKLGITEIRNVGFARKGDQFVPYQIIDDLTPDQIKAYRIADNKLNESDWDMALIDSELATLSTELQELTGFTIEDLEGADQDAEYSSKIEAPIYEPKNEKPPIAELVEIEKVDQLISEIESAKISKEDKEFLKFAARRHYVFNYEKIADYYAHSSDEVKKLMEKSALVIIDWEKAIEYGYVQLSEKIIDQFKIDTNEK